MRKDSLEKLVEDLILYAESKRWPVPTPECRNRGKAKENGFKVRAERLGVKHIYLDPRFGVEE
jgi:hypothetical protein